MKITSITFCSVLDDPSHPSNPATPNTLGTSFQCQSGSSTSHFNVQESKIEYIEGKFERSCF